MILSVSRRTDIPFFYSEWFLDKLKKEKIAIKNIYNNSIYEYDLNTKNIDCIVFWTKDSLNFDKCLDYLEEKKFNFYFQYTLNNYPKIFEPNVRNINDRIKTFKELSNRIGKNKVIWRYDPIIVSNITDLEYHKKNFLYLINEIGDYTEKIIISFIDIYSKLIHTFNELKRNENIEIIDIIKNKIKLKELCEFIVLEAKKRNIIVESCAENVSEYGIKSGSCIDGNFINKTFNLNNKFNKDYNQRKECGCIKSIDIGVYDTCLFNCSYCYANMNIEKRKENFKKINNNNIFLL